MKRCCKIVATALSQRPNFSSLLLLSCRISHVQPFVTPWTVACQGPLSMGFPRQEYWSGLPFPLPGGLPGPGIKSTSLATPALAGRFFTSWATGEAQKEASSSREWLLGTRETKQDPAGPFKVQKLLFVSCVWFVRGKKWGEGLGS